MGLAAGFFAFAGFSSSESESEIGALGLTAGFFPFAGFLSPSESESLYSNLTFFFSAGAALGFSTAYSLTPTSFKMPQMSRSSSSSPIR